MSFTYFSKTITKINNNKSKCSWVVVKKKQRNFKKIMNNFNNKYKPKYKAQNTFTFSKKEATAKTS